MSLMQLMRAPLAAALLAVAGLAATLPLPVAAQASAPVNTAAPAAAPSSAAAPSFTAAPAAAVAKEEVTNPYGLDALWSQGDFNGDAVVNFDDLLVLAQHYGTSLSLLPPRKSSTDVGRANDGLIV